MLGLRHVLSRVGKDGDDLLEMTRPFVFRKYVDYTAFEAMREMKAMIEREVSRRNIADDIKLGAGGIREVEFIRASFSADLRWVKIRITRSSMFGRVYVIWVRWGC